MKLLVATVLTALLAFVGGLYFSWWIIAVTAFISVLLIPMRGGKAFLAGFLGIFILWALLAWWIDVKNNGVLATKVAQIFPLGGSSFLLILVAALVGGLVGGMAALCGSYLRNRA